MISTISGPAKAEPATTAGAHFVIDYTIEAVAEQIREICPSGVDMIVEVAPVVNEAVLGVGGTITMYATDGGAELRLSFVPPMMANARIQLVIAFGVPPRRKSGGLWISARRSPPVRSESARITFFHCAIFSIEDGAGAHAAVEPPSVGKVLIDIRQ
ncbi:hypothetical protein [Rhodococcus sp. KBS0724]|uniref:hypothetical protein n=1 Tax=Rhodococcus sp. KBS0724 TaxID=1179674 RepID=UPI0021B0CBFA|nr:hypothetical protein [Rhodococcus sp. KBS0724]